jgi:hypothetical protein
MKKLFAVLALILCVAFATPAMAQANDICYGGCYDETYMDQQMLGPFNLVVTGVEIGGIEMIDNDIREYCCGCKYDYTESFTWGGLSVDVIMLQGAVMMQDMHTTSCCPATQIQGYDVSQTFTSPGFTVEMNAEAFQVQHTGYSYGYGDFGPR